MTTQKQKLLVTLNTEMISVENLSEYEETWDAKKAGAVLGRSRRSVVRYIEQGFLDAVKVQSPNGPKWRIVPFSVRKISGPEQEYLNKIAKLERELESYKFQPSTDQAREISPGFLQTLAAFFMVSGARLGLSQRPQR